MIDLVVSGPDLSGTTTQVQTLIEFFQAKGKKIRDISGTEIDALFHAEVFSQYNQQHISLKEYLKDNVVPEEDKHHVVMQAHKLMSMVNGGLKVASMVKNKASTYVNPDAADVWILEEPPRRGAGQVCRAFELERSQYGSEMNPVAAAYAHSAYRSDEFFRFRKILRAKNKIIIRSRSEESGVYQIYEPDFLPNGIERDAYINLPGHMIAFGNPPTHLFIVHANSNWSEQEYIALMKQRCKDRIVDDYENNAHYQTKVINKRYSTAWIDDFYNEACSRYASRMPEIYKFNLYDSIEDIKEQMYEILRKIVK